MVIGDGADYENEIWGYYLALHHIFMIGSKIVVSYLIFITCSILMVMKLILYVLKYPTVDTSTSNAITAL